MRRCSSKASFPLARHDRVWLRRGWPGELRTPLEAASFREVKEWCRNGRPLVAGRRLPGDRLDDVRLGLALPGRRRIAVHVGGAAVLRHAPPPTLRDVMPAAPLAWRGKLAKLAAITEALAIRVGAYGSLAWQHHARDGMTWLSAASDIDLLFHPADRAGVSRLLSELKACDATDGPRIDGEIVLPDGSAVAWRELAAWPDRILTRSIDAVALRDTTAVMSLFERRTA